MKKVFSLLTIVAMGISMIGCGEEKKVDKKPDAAKPAAGDAEKPKT